MKRDARVEAYNELPHSGKMDNSDTQDQPILKQDAEDLNGFEKIFNFFSYIYNPK